MNNDRELLELAARAGNIKGHWMCFRDNFGIGTFGYPPWNSLADDREALRLAIFLKFDVMTSCIRDEIQIGGAVQTTIFEPINGDRYAATRRAITRAAAEIGKTL